MRGAGAWVVGPETVEKCYEVLAVRLAIARGGVLRALDGEEGGAAGRV